MPQLTIQLPSDGPSITIATDNWSDFQNAELQARPYGQEIYQKCSEILQPLRELEKKSDFNAIDLHAISVLNEKVKTLPVSQWKSFIERFTYIHSNLPSAYCRVEGEWYRPLGLSTKFTDTLQLCNNLTE